MKAKDLYLENSETLSKETEDDTNRRKDLLRSWIGRLSIVKMTILSIAIHRFNVLSNKISVIF